MGKKIMVITGASSGVGSALAVHFSSHGYVVCGIARSRDRLDAVKKKIPYDLITHQCDLRSLKQVKRTFERIISDHNHIDVLINNAGVFERKPFNEQEIETIDRIVDTNLKGAMYCTHLVKLTSQLMQFQSQKYAVKKILKNTKLLVYLYYLVPFFTPFFIYRSPLAFYPSLPSPGY